MYSNNYQYILVRSNSFDNKRIVVIIVIIVIISVIRIPIIVMIIAVTIKVS
jgi:hypothetical protein